MRRELLKLAGFSLSGLAAPCRRGAQAGAAPMPRADPGSTFDVRAFGAVGDGRTLDTPAVNAAIQAAAIAGGGTVRLPSGTYTCHSIHLKSSVALYLDPGATILAAQTPHEGTPSGGYDAAESNAPWEEFQDFGHNHWHNSLIWGEDLHDVGILGPGLIWGRGLARGHDDPELPLAEAPGVGNKAIALKNCHNVVLRDFSILAGGHFGILATGVDNLTIDNLKVDTNRDGIDIDCCRNVRVSNCSVNSPWDDGICPKSSFALGYARPTENVTISNCYVTGGYRVGTLLDGSFQRFGPEIDSIEGQRTGRIKCGTESNGGFRNIAVSNCVFESCRGFALESVDGGLIEDITVTGVTMRDIRNSPLFLRLGARMNGPKGVAVGVLKRVLISDVMCDGPANVMPSIIGGVPGHRLEDVRIGNCYFLARGGGTAETAAVQPPEQESGYPEPFKMGPLPAQHLFIRHANNIELSNIEFACATADARPCLWLADVNGADLFRIMTPRMRGGGPALLLNDVSDFRVSGSRGIRDLSLASVPHLTVR